MDSGVEVEDLKVWYPVKKGILARTAGFVKAVDGVSFSVGGGETLGIVGESGSGKSTVARAIVGLVKPTAGTIRRAGAVSMVFQDPLGSLNPRRTVGSTLAEAIAMGSGNDWTVAKLLEKTGLPTERSDRYPHELSGGERQRVSIARAIATRPEILICDEAVSALDLSIRSQILSLIDGLRREMELTVIFITHDLGVARHIADRIVVMNAGKIVESGTAAEVMESPREEYTKRLVAAVPRICRGRK